MCTWVWRTEIDLGRFHSSVLQLMLWSKVSHWTCNPSAQIGWLASETQGSACLHPLSTGAVVMAAEHFTGWVISLTLLETIYPVFLLRAFILSSTLSSGISVPAVPSQAFVSASLFFFMISTVLLFIGVIWAGALLNHHVGEAAPPWSPWVCPLENVFYEGKLQFLSLSGPQAASAAHHSPPLSVRFYFPLVVLWISLRAYLVWPRSLFPWKMCAGNHLHLILEWLHMSSHGYNLESKCSQIDHLCVFLCLVAFWFLIDLAQLPLPR